MTAAGASEVAETWSERIDVWILGALLALTATFGRGFSTIGFSGPSIYVTEVAIVVCAVLAARRLGLSGLAEAFARLPLVPLLVFWLAAAVAVVSGLLDYGLGDTLEDIGLGEYSILLPLTVAVASSPERAILLAKILVGGLIAGTCVYGVSDLSVRLFGAEGTFFDVQEITFGLYMSLLVAFVGGRIAAAAPTSRLVIACAGAAMVLVFLSNARGVWISVGVGLATITAFAPAGRRLRFGVGSVVAIACAFALALGIQSTQGATQISNEVSGAVNGLKGKAGTAADVTESENAGWRLAFWKEILDRSTSHPFFGVGYGEPIAFTWHGKRYDFRDGSTDSSVVSDVDGPHNEFLHILYRMGYIGLAGLLGILGVILWRAYSALRAGIGDRELRGLVLGLVGMVLVCSTVASFADALKSPFLGIFLWASLGLLLAALPFNGSAAPSANPSSPAPNEPAPAGTGSGA